MSKISGLGYTRKAEIRGPLTSLMRLGKENIKIIKWKEIMKASLLKEVRRVMCNFAPLKIYWWELLGKR